MSFPADNKALLDHLHMLSLQHEQEQEQAATAGVASSKKPETVLGRQASSFAIRKSPDFSSVSSEGPEHDGGVRLDASSLRGSPAFARRSEAAAKALRPTSSATATLRAQKMRAQDEDDVFMDAVAKSEKPTNLVVSSSAYELNQSHIQQADLKGRDVSARNAYVGGSPTKGRSYKIGDPIDPQATYPATACIFVANLPENRDDFTIEAAVTKEFERFGVVFVKIRRDNVGMPFAFVQFTNDESARDARDKGKGALILGRPCRTETVRANRTYIIYRSNRSAISIEEANELLTPFGDIETIRFLDQEIQEQMRLPVTIRVQFKVFDPTQQVLRAFRLNKVYNVEAYDFKKAMQARARNPNRAFLDHYDRDRRSIFIGDLPLNFSEEDIRTLMEDVGGVVSVQIKRLDYNREGPKLIAFVEFTNPHIPEMAIERYHLNEIGGSIVRVERRTDRRRRDHHTPARIQNFAYTGPSASGVGGRPPSTPAREQRLAIEAGPSALVVPEAVHGTPSVYNESRPAMDPSAIQSNAGTTHLNVQGMQPQMQTPIQPQVQQQIQPQMHHMHQMQSQMPTQVQQIPQMQPHMQPQIQHMQPQMPAQIQHPVGQAFNQAPVQFPMAPPPLPSPMHPAMHSAMPAQMGPQVPPQQVPPQMGTPMGPGMANMGQSPYVATPYSQGHYSQGPGSSYGFMTPQQSPAHFWGYGNGTPLWTPFPIDPAAFMAYSSPMPPPRSNAGVAGAPAAIQAEANQVVQSEPVMVDNNLNQVENQQQVQQQNQQQVQQQIQQQVQQQVQQHQR